ncbi:serpin-ZX-like [Cucurbita moschata]|uniref:Serpin-ZX-like n=1 Tax=Cucurbita moschata TaxID=3662 RepID=A0A6J1HDP4_CUCMO|nr:serpin-ZX-like [Cucurbita moschata]
MDIREAIRNHGDVAMAITKRILQHDKAKASNVVISPLSIYVLLSLVAAGSKGPTLDQFLSFLKSNSIDNLNAFASYIIDKVFADGSSRGEPRLAFVNGVWIDQSLSLKPSFQQVVDKYYKAMLRQVDFQQANEVISEVNSWVEKNTYGLIKEILPAGSVGSSTQLILVNALYFKAAWQQAFDASKTVKHDFYLVDGSSVEAPFMSGKKDQYVAVFDGFKVLSLPYSQGCDPRRFSMYFFLPDRKDGLGCLIEKLDSEPGFIDRHIPCQKQKLGRFMIPKFKISFGIEVSDVLKKLGLVLPFTEGGLLGMVESPMAQNLHVSKVFHKAFIEVNEEGTEAAASTAIEISNKSLALDQINFVADHPFLYLIREDKSGTLLFIGQVLNPLVH